MNLKNISVTKVKSCRGCSHANYKGNEMIEKIQEAIEKSAIEEKMRSFAKSHFLLHHPFEIILARCPNGCSRPQIADVSIVAIQKPIRTEERCLECGKCEEECNENAIDLSEGFPVFNYELCVNCGDCITVCPSGTISSEEVEYEFSVGGRLGRHPRFAMEMGRTSSSDQLIQWTENTVEFYKENIAGEERFSVVLDRYGIENFKEYINIKR